MRPRPRAILPLAALVALTLHGSVALANPGDDVRDVGMVDNVFSPRIVRIPVGGEVEWTNDGRSLHNVTADDGAFASDNLEPGESFTHTFDEAGAFPFFCSLHGTAGAGMAGVILVGDAPLPGAASDVGPGREQPPSLPGVTIRVPKDAPTIQEAVDAADPGGLVLVSPGVYREAVVVTTPFLTIRGLDRNRTILDGGLRLDNGIQVIEADGVAIENLTARHYVLNGFLWSDVFGYRGSYLTAYDDGDYGLFAYGSEFGQFDHSYASGHPDSGFYIGQCRPCHAVVTNVLAEDNALGFSGTNAGGDLFVVNSEWRDNMSGIVPNTLDSEELAPQRGMVIAGNWVHDNNNAQAPAKDLQYPSLGIGIIVNGGRDDLVTQNLVEDHVNFGERLAHPGQRGPRQPRPELGRCRPRARSTGRRRRLLQRQRLLDEPAGRDRVAQRLRLVAALDGRSPSRSPSASATRASSTSRIPSTSPRRSPCSELPSPPASGAC
jgi:plastocyanin